MRKSLLGIIFLMMLLSVLTFKESLALDQNAELCKDKGGRINNFGNALHDEYLNYCLDLIPETCKEIHGVWKGCIPPDCSDLSKPCTNVLCIGNDVCQLNEYAFEKIPITITTDKEVYEKTEIAHIVIKNLHNTENAIFNFEITNPSGELIPDENCLFYEKSPDNLISPNSEIEIKWDFQNCNFELWDGIWEISSKLTVQNKISDLVTIKGIKLVKDLALEEFSCRYGKSQQISFSANGTNVKAICLDQDSSSLIVEVNSFEKGDLKLDIPRIILDPKKNECDDDGFFVLVNGEEINYEETKNDKFRFLTIPITPSTIEIELISSGIIGMVPSSPTIKECQKEIQQKFRPFEQIRYGISKSEIVCKSNLELLFKINDSPACVKPNHIAKLIGYGWSDYSQFCISKTGPPSSVVPYMCGLPDQECIKYGGLYIKHGFSSPPGVTNYGWGYTCVLDYNLDRIKKNFSQDVSIEIISK